MLEPYRGRVYDPCCGSSGMFVQSVAFIRAHASGNGNGGKARGDISIYGQESNYTTWRLAKMNLAIRGIEGQIAQGDSFHNDRHPDLKADFILANPPFNISDWGGERLTEDKRWRYGVPPKGNANFAWVQHMVHHLAPTLGIAGFVLANGLDVVQGSPARGRSEEPRLRRAWLDCMVAMPGQLFLLDADSGLPLVPCPQPPAPRRGSFHRRPQVGQDGGPDASRVDRRRYRPDLGSPTHGTGVMAPTWYEDFAWHPRGGDGPHVVRFVSISPTC